VERFVESQATADKMHAAEKLSATKVAKLKAPGRYGDGRGLWLHVGPNGTKSWVLRYMRHGTAREMGLGPLHAVSLADARDLARTARRRLIVDGLDPIDWRKAHQAKSRIAMVRGITFKEAADRYIAAHEASWKNAKHREQWRATLNTYADPVIGKVSIAAVDTALVLKILEPIWTTKSETASRLRGRIEAILDWATARDYRSGDNPARWGGHLKKLLPEKTKLRRVKHHPAMPYADLPAFVAELRRQEGVSARALEFLILTATRTGEVIGARNGEFNFTDKVWTIPGERMKAGREHRVPLGARALEILAELPREGNFVFLGRFAGKPLSNMAMLELIRELRPGFVPHGFRSSFRDWAYERSNYPREIVEAALAHATKDKTEAAYKRGDALEKRRRLMRDWERHCATLGAAGVVVPLKSGS
jgi:integrase